MRSACLLACESKHARVYLTLQCITLIPTLNRDGKKGKSKEKREKSIASAS